MISIPLLETRRVYDVEEGHTTADCRRRGRYISHHQERLWQTTAAVHSASPQLPGEGHALALQTRGSSVFGCGWQSFAICCGAHFLTSPSLPWLFGFILVASSGFSAISSPSPSRRRHFRSAPPRRQAYIRRLLSDYLLAVKLGDCSRLWTTHIPSHARMCSRWVYCTRHLLVDVVPTFQMRRFYRDTHSPMRIRGAPLSSSRLPPLVLGSDVRHCPRPRRVQLPSSIPRAAHPFILAHTIPVSHPAQQNHNLALTNK